MQLPKTLLHFIWFFVKKQKAYFIAIQILFCAWALDSTLWPYFLKMLIDKIMAFSASGNIGIWHYLMPVLIFGVLLWLIIELGFRVSGFMMAKVFPKFEAHIRMAMFEYVQDHSYDYFANNFAGNISNRISDMTQSATRIMQLIMTLFVPTLLALIIATSIFFSVNSWFAILLSGWVVLHMGICFLGAGRCSKLANEYSTSRSYLTGKVVDSFTNIINVKLFARKRFECEYINNYQLDEKQKNIESRWLIEKIKVALSISAFIFPGVLLTWYMIYCWQHGQISVGDLVLIFNTAWNIQFLAWISGLELPNFYKEIGVCQQALTLVQAEHEIKDQEKATELQIKQGKIDFQDVNFHYLKGTKVFKDVSITIEAGSKVGLVGFSGSGKSTFVNLIMRFFDIESGEIKIDGQNIKNVTLESLRSQVSMIPQAPSLFHRSLRENICYGKVGASEAEIVSAAKHANCHEFITELADGYDSLVGERGIKLSGGQRQRIAIARAILENSPILILDEATSALDSVTEKRIQDALHYLMQGKTTIVIAHRLSTLAEMDRILVFDNGRIVEDGKHQDLIKSNGHYAKLWQMQAGGFLPDNPEQAIE